MNFSFSALIDAPSFEQAIVDAGENFIFWSSYRENLQQDLLDGHPPQNEPLIAHTLGCPASGKTTLLAYCCENGYVPEDAFFLAFDRIMEEFPAYRNDIAERGLQAAFEKWEVPARALGYELLAFALDNKINIVFEHSGARRDHLTLLEAFKQHGYRVMILDTQCRTEIALSRVQNRNRYLPPEYIHQRREIINLLRPEYYLLADEIRLYNTENFPPVLLEQP